MRFNNRLVVTARVLVWVWLGLMSACTQTPTWPTSEITRERAIEIARQQLTFEPTSIEGTMGERQDKQVWIVTFRRADGSHGGLGQFMEVTLDRSTGEVVTVAMS